MEQYISKSALVAEIEKRIKELQNLSKEDEKKLDSFQKTAIHLCIDECKVVLNILDTLKVKDLYEQYVQYPSIKDGIEAHAETYSFNIESELFNQLTKEQQALWRKEIEQACISGGDAGVELARDTRYKENLEVKEVDLEDSVKETLAQKYIDYTFKRHNIDPESKEGQLIYYAYMHGMNQCLDQLNKQLWNSTYQKPL